MMEEKQFNVPIVLIVFKRSDTVTRIIGQIRQVRPAKLYIISDHGRNEQEQKLVANCRQVIEKAIDWPCEVIKNYAEENRGVYNQIALGARWVFEKEEEAIFLEDDNLPEVSFFYYCESCLKKYKDNKQIFWICGTNYLQKCNPKRNATVFKSQHLMPCGWASWSDKFLSNYDFDLNMAERPNWQKELKKKYKDKRLYIQQRRSIKNELEKKQNNKRYNSWDFHTCFTLRMKDLWGIVPKNNQIKNIGVDEFSTHGGNSINLEMTRRFCGINSYPLDGEFVLPNYSDLDTGYEKEIGKIILYPFKARIILWLKDFFHVPNDTRLRDFLLRKKR